MQRINQILCRAVLPAEAGHLGDLALRSKAHWGYSEAFLEACRAELSYSPGQIEDASSDFVVAMVEDAVAGQLARALGLEEEGAGTAESAPRRLPRPDTT